MSTELSTKTAKPAAFDLSPRNFEEAWRMAEILANSDMVPKDFRGKPENCLIAMQWGSEVGLKAMQALQNIAVINGRPSMWGDAVIALALSNPICESIIEEDDGFTATCRVKRRGGQEQFRTFSIDDAKAAGLAGKQGPWTQYPKRMRQMRARAFAIRDVFPDVLRGLAVAEEAMDFPVPRDMGMAPVVPPKAAGADATPEGLLQKAEAAAALGVAAYQKFFADTGPANRKLLATEHDNLKATAIAADKARTVDTPAAAPQAKQAAPNGQPDADGVIQPAKTFDDVMAMLCNAKTEDALYVAADWIDAITDADSRKPLEDKFDELLAALRGDAS